MWGSHLSVKKGASAGAQLTSAEQRSSTMPITGQKLKPTQPDQGPREPQPHKEKHDIRKV